MTQLDENAQPVIRRFNNTVNKTRDINELIGICRGIAFDDQVTQAEAEQLFSWLHSQPELVNLWPANMIYQRLVDVLQDGVLDKNEAGDVLALLKDVIGGNASLVETLDMNTGEILSDVAATTLPLTYPDQVSFDGFHFVLTGKFVTGTRAECEQEVIIRGGLCQKNPTKKTKYLVVGSVGSRDWAHSAWGRKIEKAILLREGGHELDILSEADWLKAMANLLDN